jgi:6-pyruvoyltetrahydropterin/6-carboxytetrahydropterin synthase
VFRIKKTFTFEAAHRLHGLPEKHKCGRLHGHNYRATFVLESETLDQYGFVRDYGELKSAEMMIDHILDHRCLNEVAEHQHAPELRQPTAEHIAKYLYDTMAGAWPELVAVMVSETPETEAAYSPTGRGL